MVLVPTAANGQPAVAEYRRAADNVMRAHSIHVVTGDAAGIAAIVVFLVPPCFLRLVCRQPGDPSPG
jgi:RNA polymerase sigma-70 factor (ECF subfamily)